MRERTSVAVAPSPAVWPPDDTEESVLGTSLHQTAIRILIAGLNEAAAITTPDDAAVPWQAGGQTMVRGFRRPGGSDYTTLPDVFVYGHAWDDSRGSLHVAADGPPALIIEVLSKETYRVDLDLEQGKGYSYARAGVREYLALDPSYAYRSEGGEGWQLEGGVYTPWRRDSAGRWVSAILPLSIGLEGARPAVYASDGHRLLREGEVERALREERRLREGAVERALREERRLREANERRLGEALAEQERLRRRLEALEHDE